MLRASGRGHPEPALAAVRVQGGQGGRDSTYTPKKYVHHGQRQASGGHRAGASIVLQAACGVAVPEAEEGRTPLHHGPEFGARDDPERGEIGASQVLRVEGKRLSEVRGEHARVCVAA